MMTTVIVRPLPGAPLLVRVAAWIRGLFLRRFVLRLVGIDCVVLEGRVYAVRAAPMMVVRELVPALLRCSERFRAVQITEELYDDFITALALGLGVKRRTVEQLHVPLWHLGAVIELIARVNGMPVVETGRDPGKFLAALMQSTGTGSTPTSSAPPAGPGTTSIGT
jgi:hypothetical protein